MSDQFFNFHQFDKNPMQGNQKPTDPRMVVMIGAIVISGGLAFLGDYATFTKNPPNFPWPCWPFISISKFAFWMLKDRLTTGMVVGTIYFSILGTLAWLALDWVAVHVIEPMEVKRRLAAMKREKALINRMDDGTI